MGGLSRGGGRWESFMDWVDGGSFRVWTKRSVYDARVSDGS